MATAFNEKETGRLEAFSDGVFAVAITLLSLNIRVPIGSHHLIHDVLMQWQSFVAYIVSFVTILVMWINHHALFQQIQRIDRVFMVLNGLLLMFVTFVNYPTALVAEYLTDKSQALPAMLIYNSTYIVIAILFTSLWFYAANRRRLLRGDANQTVVKAISQAYRIGPFFYIAALLLGLVSEPASLALNGLLAIYFAVSGREV